MSLVFAWVSRDKGIWTTIWSPSRSALNPTQTNGWRWISRDLTWLLIGLHQLTTPLLVAATQAIRTLSWYAFCPTIDQPKASCKQLTTSSSPQQNYVRAASALARSFVYALKIFHIFYIPTFLTMFPKFLELRAIVQPCIRKHDLCSFFRRTKPIIHHNLTCDSCWWVGWFEN
jgi:hypothetical protein